LIVLPTEIAPVSKATVPVTDTFPLLPSGVFHVAAWNTTSVPVQDSMFGGLIGVSDAVIVVVVMSLS
jgi:hypothetical protein